MRSIGVDLGSRTLEYVLLDGDRIVEYRIVDTGVKPLERALELIGDHTEEKITATGYGRHLLQERIGCEVITEIKAYARGAALLYPDCRTVIDIGGQDNKVIRVEGGRVIDFHMNDRCAAGTGRFLEIMAETLGCDISEFGAWALAAQDSVSINSMCTVFAESEVISLIARGEPLENIALGLHQSIAMRMISMLGRMGCEERVIFAGGVAKNPCLKQLLEKYLNLPLTVPPEPQIIGALGAAYSH